MQNNFNKMQHIKIPRYIPQSVLIEFNPHIKTIDIIFGVKHHPYVPNSFLDYDLKFGYWEGQHLENIFYFDANPFGEWHYLEMLNVVSTPNYQELKFGVKENDSHFYYFDIESQSISQTIAQEIIINTNNQKHKIEFYKTDLHQIKVKFENNELINLNFRNIFNEEGKSFTILLENDKYILILYRPFQRFTLYSFSIENHTLHCEHEKGSFSCYLDVNDYFYDIIEKLVCPDAISPSSSKPT